MSDVQAMFSTDTESPAPTSLLRAVGDLLDRIGKTSSDGGSFRRLRIFSGTFPTPVGEESFDLWNEQAYLMISECDCSDKEKKRRIMESIRGPALEVIKVARDDAPDLSSRDYVNALERAFGSAESGEDLYFTFRLMQQLPREKLSDFVRRLEKPLSKVLQKGGISLADKDRVRVEQLLRGADPRADLKLLQLRLRERLSNPPNFLQLLSEIRTEEEYEDSRAKLSTSVHNKRVNVQPAIQTDIQELKRQLQDLKTQLSSIVKNDSTVGVTDLKAHSPPDTVVDSCPNEEITALKKQEQQKRNRFRVVKNHMKFWIKKCKMDLKWIHLVWKCLKYWTFQ
ncbi:paraneoplastic antigen Ma1 homolog [Denticeps clupeoides]|uniref:paraneoplastic antigen Ma1 homolog n=1 Tax=Denticeps clupeoides TaxID=299321 RepID=UPI0010A2EEC5|nr:paraneoplastic antigen Ma1 homolog [Denticeps clupeoides]